MSIGGAVTGASVLQTASGGGWPVSPLSLLLLGGTAVLVIVLGAVFGRGRGSSTPSDADSGAEVAGTPAAVDGYDRLPLPVKECMGELSRLQEELGHSATVEGNEIRFSGGDGRPLRMRIEGRSGVRIFLGDGDGGWQDVFAPREDEYVTHRNADEIFGIVMRRVTSDDSGAASS